MLTEYTTKIKNKLSKAGIDFTTYNHIRTIEDEIEDLYLLEIKSQIIFCTKNLIYVPIHLDELQKEKVKIVIQSLSKKDVENSLEIKLNLLRFDTEDEFNILSSLYYLDYLLKEEDLKDISESKVDFEDKLKNYLTLDKLNFIEISLDNVIFLLNEEKESIFEWINTLCLQVSIKTNVNISIKKFNFLDKQTLNLLEKVVCIEREVYFDDISLKFLLRAQKQIEQYPHIAYLEYYHVIERFMKDIKYVEYINKYKKVYLALSDNRLKDSEKKDKVINIVETIDSDTGELKLFNKIIEPIFAKNVYDILFKRTDLEAEEKTTINLYIKNLKKGAPYWESSNEMAISDNEEFKNLIAKRLYATRNSIVHSKSFSGEGTFDIDDDVHKIFLEMDLYILKYIVLSLLVYKYETKRLNHFINFTSF